MKKLATLLFALVFLAGFSPWTHAAVSLSWQTYNGHEYALTLDTINSWYGASDFATSQGAYLVTIGSAGENDFVKSLLSSGENAWIGLSYSHDSGWAWVTGESATYLRWAPGEPNNSGGGEYYGEISYLGYWNDTGWIDLNKAIIERQAPVPIPAAIYLLGSGLAAIGVSRYRRKP